MDELTPFETAVCEKLARVPPTPAALLAWARGNFKVLADDRAIHYLLRLEEVYAWFSNPKREGRP